MSGVGLQQKVIDVLATQRSVNMKGPLVKCGGGQVASYYAMGCGG